ncbi:FepA family TonB-dependent siderophore receptor [Falsirhodobacter xinxiangensis]|uniref:FepA family TonB-dependent siderophore receptor n=1 Tax=Falsirhodobacter xinxiangensis TaxID=2530049 RepID=UPI001C7066EB|nr:FepA family TonB-dependent siderophore receptor [Rhodobacter xinxiangensis]
MMQPHKLRRSCVAALLGTSLIVPVTALAQTSEEPIELAPIVITAEEQAKQALGASTITAEDLEKQPVANDISEIIRKMPGINLTGNSTSGQRGNNRQIDVRGMGPENTLILIDGKPVLSRNSVKMGRAGERDTRGDSNWVPPELVERIEVLRGPAAARYGSGASGGVVNIITKRPDTFTGQVGLSFHLPEGSDEGGGKRTNFMLAGPVGEKLSFRLTGNYNKTDADSPEINDAASNSETASAGREGVVNKDLTGLLTWAPRDGHEIDFELGFSRQGNIFAGERGTFGSGAEGSFEDGLAQRGLETNTMYRSTLGVTHRGEYSFGESFSYLQWENTRNRRLGESSTGRNEGTICEDCPPQRTTLDNINAKTEWVLPLTIAGREQSLTLGAEVRHERMNDNGNPLDNGAPSKLDQTNIGLYAENNILWDDRLTLTPAVRVDWADTYGFNASPSLNATYAFTDEWSMKVGVARAFKSPNLYQLNPNYRYNSGGNGCQLVNGLTEPCKIQGNPDLKPETSLNTEVGIAYEGLDGISGSLAYFHNDYKDRIAAGNTQIGVEPDGQRVFIWDNTPEAKVSGLEGSFSAPLGERFAFSVNATYMLKSEDQRGQPLSLVPKYTINSALDWLASDDLTVTLSMTNYGRIESRTINSNTGGELPAEEIEDRPSYTLVNLGAKWDMTETAHLSAGVTNLFDEQLFRTGIGANTFNEPGRAFYLSINKTF